MHKINFFYTKYNPESKTRMLRDLPDQEIGIQDQQMRLICTIWQKYKQSKNHVKGMGYIFNF